MRRTAFQQFAKHSDWFLLASLVLSLLFLFLIECYYYLQILEVGGLRWVLALTYACLLNASAFAFCLAGSNNLMEGKKLAGWLGLIFSFAITGYTCAEMYYVADFLDPSHSNKFSSLLICFESVSVLRLAVELRLSLSVGSLGKLKRRKNGKMKEGEFMDFEEILTPS